MASLLAPNKELYSLLGTDRAQYLPLVWAMLQGDNESRANQPYSGVFL
jgi:hypothetical protein